MQIPSPMPRTERVLLVEDDEFSHQLIDIYLRKAGFTQIANATDGKQALDLARKDIFDIIILDLNLPKLSGVEVLKRLNKDGFLGDSAVLIISSMSNIDETAQCIELGAQDYLPKPFNTRLLEIRIDTCLELKRLKEQARRETERRRQEIAAAHALGSSLEQLDFTTLCRNLPVETAARREAAATGGDLFDLFRSTDGRLWALLGEGTGGGVLGALTAARLRLLVRRAAEAGGSAPPLPGAVLTAVNRELAATGTGGESGGAVFLAAVAPSGESLHYAAAGLPAAYLLRPEAPPRPAPIPPGRPLGQAPDSVYAEEALAWVPGDSLCAVSGGVSAAAGPARLESLLGRLSALPAAEMVGTLQESVSRTLGTAPRPRDATALVLRRVG